MLVKVNKWLGIVAGIAGVLVLTWVLISGYYWYANTFEVSELKPHEIYDQMKRDGPPVAEMTDLDGLDIKLSDYHGKILIVNFWASWCAPCVDEIPSLTKLRDLFKDQLFVVAVSSDQSREDIVAFRKSFPAFGEPNIWIVWDETKGLIKKFGIAKLPESVIFGKDGKAIKKIVGSIDWMSEEAQTFMRESLGQSM